MHFFSTNRTAPPVTFREALLKGQAPDRGLYMPEYIPQLSKEQILAFSGMTYPEMAYTIISQYLGDEIDAGVLAQMTADAYDFEVPLEKVFGNNYILRLDQGPTASFKDFAARMMGRLMQHYLRMENRKMLILTATSGDTGSAIANAFYGLDNIEVVVLFPEKEVTTRQRKQMTTLGRNVKILALDAKFDDCQALVKQAFSDPDLDYLQLSSANSINIGRLVPQIVYYFYAFSRLRKGDAADTVVFSVPSGNFGDMMGGVLGMKMGLPVSRFIIATNENDEFPRFLTDGKYNKIVPSRNCISSAMNVGHPSNLARLVGLYGGMMDEAGNIRVVPDMEGMRRELYAVSVSDELTRQTIRDTYENYGTVLEPHGAVGWRGLMEYLASEGTAADAGQLCISLETAHPAKFPEQINELLRFDPELPPSLVASENKPESFEYMNSEYGAFKEFLTANYR